ncbi:MAG: hypothetical protein AB1529_02525 [Candidatus Micrarchaeota archaeon]
MKGYLNTMVVLLLSSLLLFLYLSYQGFVIREANRISELTPAAYPSYYTSDVAYDLEKMAANVSASRSGPNVSIVIGDSLDERDTSALLSDYRDFIEGNYSPRIGANISLNLSPMRDGSYELLFSDGNYYSRNYSAQNQTALFSTYNSTNQTGLKNVTINITASGQRLNTTPWAWSPGGDTFIVINYEDDTGSFTDSGNISSTTLKSYLFSLQGGSVNLTYGNLPPEGSLLLRASNTTVTVVMALSKQLNEPLGYSYNASIGYSQGKVRRDSRITIGST